MEKAGSVPGRITYLKKKIKHISDRNFQLKMVPLDAEPIKPFKYMCFCPIKIFCGLTDGRKDGSCLEIEAKIKNVLSLAAPT